MKATGLLCACFLIAACATPARTIRIPADPSRVTLPLAIVTAASAYYCRVGTWPTAFVDLEPTLQQAGLLEDVTPALLEEYRASIFRLQESGSLGVYRYPEPNEDPPVNWEIGVPADCSRFDRPKVNPKT